MTWFQKLMPSRIRTEGGSKRTVPEGLWKQCPACNAVLYQPDLEASLNVCPKCAHHMPMAARKRLRTFFDDGELQEIGGDLEAVDALKFKDSKKYKDRLVQAQKITGEREALVVGRGTVHQRPLVACAFEFRFLGGSMGSVVGERFARGVSRCLDEGIPLVCFAASGGARMQEALFSLLQMANTSAALARLARRGLPYISVLTNPTTGGVSASLGMQGDINIGEPQALIGFAGPRVIEQTVREKLPEGFQRSEFLLEHGAIDMIVDRRNLRDRVAGLLGMLMHQPPQRAEEPDEHAMELPYNP